MPAGARRQLTFFPDRVNGGWYQPTRGEYLVFSKDLGGNEFYQFFRLDLASGDVTMLTDGKSRNDGLVWNRAGDRIAYTSTRRNGTDSDIYVMDPGDPETDRLLMRVDGGGWGPLEWSSDGYADDRAGIHLNQRKLSLAGEGGNRREDAAHA